MFLNPYSKHLYDFSADYNVIEISDIIDIHKYLMENHDMMQSLD